jgi:hypothetical protein
VRNAARPIANDHNGPLFRTAAGETGDIVRGVGIDLNETSVRAMVSETRRLEHRPVTTRNGALAPACCWQ